MIVDHVWRPNHVPGQDTSLCAYMNCRRPAAEHAYCVDLTCSTRTRYRGTAKDGPP